MTKLFTVAGLVAALLLSIGVASVPAALSETTGDTPTALAQQKPSWLTSKLEAQIVAAGPKGLEVPLTEAQALEVELPRHGAAVRGHRRRLGDGRLGRGRAWSRRTAAR